MEHQRLTNAEFERYWRQRRSDWVEQEVAVLPVPHRADEPRRLEISHRSGTIGAWLTGTGLDDPGAVRTLVVMLHGYGGLDAQSVSEPPLPHCAVLWPCLTGLGALSLRDDVPCDAQEHVLHGIESPGTYVHGDCVEDVWATVEAGRHLFPELESIHLVGSSFGGGMACLAAPWEPDVASVVVDVPSFGDHRARLRAPSVGSALAVQQRYAQDESILNTLDHFDAATAARFIRVPVLAGVADVDPAVPPQGQKAIAEALPGGQIVALSEGHPTPEDEATAFEEATWEFIDQHRPSGD